MYYFSLKKFWWNNLSWTLFNKLWPPWTLTRSNVIELPYFTWSITRVHPSHARTLIARVKLSNRVFKCPPRAQRALKSLFARCKRRYAHHKMFWHASEWYILNRSIKLINIHILSLFLFFGSRCRRSQYVFFY